MYFVFFIVVNFASKHSRQVVRGKKLTEMGHKNHRIFFIVALIRFTCSKIAYNHKLQCFFFCCPRNTALQSETQSPNKIKDIVSFCCNYFSYPTLPLFLILPRLNAKNYNVSATLITQMLGITPYQLTNFQKKVFIYNDILK